MLTGNDDPVRGNAVAPAKVRNQLAERGGNLFDLCALREDGRSQLHWLAAAIEKLDADVILDLPDSPGKGGLRQVAPFGRAAERPRLRNRKYIFQPLESHRMS